MDIVYASLRRRHHLPARAGEAAEVTGALWAHATPDDGLEHATAVVEPDRVDLLLYLLTRTPPTPAAPTAVQRAADLLTRCHQASPHLRRSYLPPTPPAAATQR
ncbi:hypothetical protein [Kitasatospora paranensis]|uniref:Aminoglycoside phosphotransferase domain-containing protein n=1 Tax=Kitasatospora paranensis TaxID=258053 RepID=A0ABW2FVQ9_9ACTN